MKKSSKIFIILLSVLIPILLVVSAYVWFSMFYHVIPFTIKLTPKEKSIQQKILDKANYCEKDSDCVAVVGVYNACEFVNKAEVTLTQKIKKFQNKQDCYEHSSVCEGNICRDTTTRIDMPPHYDLVPLNPIYAADFSQDNILLGASHNVFIARVIKQSGEKALGSSPETQFKVEVISNIKGDLSGTVTVDQFGGYKDGVLYTVADDNPTPNAKSADSYMLQEGNTYLLATRYNETEDWYTLNSFYTASKLLSTDKEMKMSDLKVLADNDDRVKALKEAYPKEKLLDADIQHNNTKNSFKSLPVEEQEKLKAEVSQMKADIAGQTNTSEPVVTQEVTPEPSAVVQDTVPEVVATTTEPQ